MKPYPFVALCLALLFAFPAALPSSAADSPAAVPPALPGKGLAQHDFLYAGESKNRAAFIIWKGEVVWSYDDPAGRGEVSDAVLLSNGNLLLAHQYAVQLISPEKKTDFKLTSLQLAWRLPNGNTLVNSWFNEWSGTVNRADPPVQAVEFTPDKKVAWVLRSWENPNLGPATTIQILDEPDAPEQVSFGDIK